jgi:hypothetical protein
MKTRTHWRRSGDGAGRDSLRRASGQNSRPSIAANPAAMNHNPTTSRASIRSPRKSAPSSSALGGISSVTSTAFVAPTRARGAK